ncbi:MAG: PAS domain-containing methyl-accepting chemotaxis protein [Hyphomicrobiales bacterium]
MFTRNKNSDAKFAAINRSKAIIEFKIDGTILDANENFLNTVGYEKSEIVGKHHKIFVREEERNHADYQKFWDSLRSGEFKSDEYCRITKDGSEVWIQATYNPLMGSNGKVFGIIKFATDITEQKMRAADFEGQVEAINRSQAVIEFNPEGIVQNANQNFLDATGYRLDEIAGQHHRKFIIEEETDPKEYEQFWLDLNDGKYQSSEFKRRSKSGEPIWIQASYNPIFDPTGKLQKIVKYATDITERVKNRMRLLEAQKVINSELNSITSAVNITNDQANSASAASNQASQNVQSVATGTEELSASVGEIANQAKSALNISSSAVDQAKSTNKIVSSLADAGNQIGEVVELINSIAEKTNLLALNATIEAARAGESGRGFAVVASEVKTLATQTSKATDEISSQITSVQDSTKNAVSAIETITETITQISDISMTIATAVDQQQDVTNEISANMLQASQGVETIAESILEIAQSAREASNATEKAAKTSASIA